MHLRRDERHLVKGVKDTLLKAYGLTSQEARRQYLQATLGEKETATQYLARLEGYLNVWVKKDQTPDTRDGLRDLMLRTQFEKSAPTELVAQFKINKVKTVQGMAAEADAFFEAHGYQRRKTWHTGKENQGSSETAKQQVPVSKKGQGKSHVQTTQTNQFRESNASGSRSTGQWRSWGGRQQDSAAASQVTEQDNRTQAVTCDPGHDL